MGALAWKPLPLTVTDCPSTRLVLGVTVLVGLMGGCGANVIGTIQTVPNIPLKSAAPMAQAFDGSAQSTSSFSFRKRVTVNDAEKFPAESAAVPENVLPQISCGSVATSPSHMRIEAFGWKPLPLTVTT